MTTFKTPTLSRRAFVGGMAAGLLTPSFAFAQLPSNPDVVVIGAGAAGLAATRELMGRGLQVAMIDADGRIGGRAYTDMTTFGVPYDVGAHWLHNDSSNPYNRYGRENGFTIYPASDEWRYFDKNNNEVSEDEGDEMWDVAEDMDRAIGRAAEGGRDISAAEATRSISGPWAATAAFELGPWNMAKDLANFSTEDWWESEDGDDWYCKEGFGTLVAHYGAGIPVSLETKATRIDWSSDGVTVETNKGTIRAKAVIVTVSTGVLAAGDIEFYPALSANKQQSFSDISMGTYDHIALQFSEDVFEMGDDGYMLYQVGDDGKAFGTLTNAGGHGLAYCDVGGSWADELEQQSVKARVDYALSKLRDLLGSDIDRAFVKGDATSWGQNPLTRGSYASAEPGAYRMRRVLRDSVGDRIFFAGEACHPSLWASVAGAHLSGQSVAGNVAREI
jgi:monoamine oxidase